MYKVNETVIIIDDDKMVIDTEKKLLRKYNNPAIEIISFVARNPCSLASIKNHCATRPWFEASDWTGVEEFVFALVESGVLKEEKSNVNS